MARLYPDIVFWLSPRCQRAGSRQLSAVGMCAFKRRHAARRPFKRHPISTTQRVDGIRSPSPHTLYCSKCRLNVTQKRSFCQSFYALLLKMSIIHCHTKCTLHLYHISAKTHACIFRTIFYSAFVTWLACDWQKERLNRAIWRLFLLYFLPNVSFQKQKMCTFFNCRAFLSKVVNEQKCIAFNFAVVSVKAFLIGANFAKVFLWPRSVGLGDGRQTLKPFSPTFYLIDFSCQRFGRG